MTDYQFMDDGVVGFEVEYGNAQLMIHRNHHDRVVLSKADIEFMHDQIMLSEHPQDAAVINFAHSALVSGTCQPVFTALDSCFREIKLPEPPVLAVAVSWVEETRYAEPEGVEEFRRCLLEVEPPEMSATTKDYFDKIFPKPEVNQTRKELTPMDEKFYVIRTDGNGVCFREMEEKELIEKLNDDRLDKDMEFLDKIPGETDINYWGDSLLIIRGRIAKIKPVKTVKTWGVE